jgi:hypothetical protein
MAQMVFSLALGKYLFGPFTPTDNREEAELCEYLESTLEARQVLR